MDKNCTCQPNLITRKDLQIFRGTYDEVMKQPTVNMKFYLAWDTQQIFVGNNRGIKTPYCGQYKAVIQKYMTDFKQEVYQKLDEKAKDIVIEALEGAKAEITQTLKDEFTETIGDIVREDTKDIQTQIDANKNEISKLDTSFSSAKEELSGKIETANNNINSANERITRIETEISNTAAVQYKTGEEIAELARDPATFKPTFCTLTSGIYKIGRIYYADNGEIKEMAGGGSIQKKTVDAGLSLRVSKSQLEIGNTPVSVTVTPIVAHREAVSKYSFNGTETEVLPDIAIISVDVSAAGTKALATFSGTPAASTEDTDYTVNSVTANVTVYYPWFFGNDGALEKFLPTDKIFTANITPNEDVFLYATENNLSFKDTIEGFSVPYETPVENVEYLVNGITASYYKYTFTGINDTSLSIKRE